MIVRLASVLAIASVVLLAPRGASALEEKIRVTFESPAECPDRAAFLRIVAARTRAFTLSEDATARLLRIAVSKDAAGYRGLIHVVSPQEKVRTREVRGRTCGDVVDALSLFAALTIDPNADLSDAPSATLPTPSPEPPAPPSAAPDEPALSPTASAPAPAPAAHGSSPISWSADVGLGPRFGFAGGVASELAIGLDAAPRGMRPLTPSASVEILGIWSAPVRTPGYANGSYAVAFLGGRALLCPVGWRAERVELRACGLVEAGSLRAASSNVPRASRQTGGSLSVGGDLGVAIGASRTVWLGLDAALIDAAVRHSFFLGGAPAYVQPELAGLVDFRVWVTIP